MGEYTPGGVMLREYVWLGDRLVGMLSQQEKGVLYVHTDHLGAPRAVSNGATVLWRWDGEAFGNSPPNERVAGLLRKLTMPVRFPGQYYDQETGINYNYFRDYSPATGRYIQSDPIGLLGGLNTYAYVEGNPVILVDPYGLWPFGMPGKGQAQQQLPGALQNLVPGLTPGEAQQLAKDAIDALTWKDVNDIKNVTPDIMHTPQPDSMDDLTDAQKDLLKKLLDRLPQKDKPAADKVKKACE